MNNKKFYFFFCYLYSIYLSHILTYKEVTSYERLNKIYNNEYHNTRIAHIAKKDLNNNNCFSTDYSINICYTDNSFQLSIIPVIYYKLISLDQYFIVSIDDIDLSPSGNNRFIGLNSQRKAILKLNNNKIFQIYDSDSGSIFINVGIVENSFNTFEISNQINRSEKYLLTSIKNDKVLITTCDISGSNILIKYFLFNYSVVKELEYSITKNIFVNPTYNNCKNIQTVEIKNNDNSYIITCFFVINYGITCISSLIQEKMIISNQERIIGLCNDISSMDKNTFILLSNDTFAMIGCGSTDAKIVKIDENLNEIGNQIIFENSNEIGEKRIYFDFFLRKNNNQLVFIYLIENNNEYRTYHEEYYIPICNNSEKYWTQNITYDFKFLIDDYNNPQKTFIRFLSNPNYMKTLITECITFGCQITEANPLYLYGSEEDNSDSLNYTIEYMLYQEELEDHSQKCIINIINCYKNCLTCFGIGNEKDNKCLSCKVDNLNNIGWNQTKNSNCMTQTEGYYFEYDNNENDYFYKLCHPKCKSCFKNGNYTFSNCFECNNNLNYFPIINESNFQSRNCYLKTDFIPGFYFNENNKIFNKCQDNCIQCSNESMSNNNQFGCEVCDYENDYYPLYVDSNKKKANCIHFNSLNNQPYFFIGERYNKNSYFEKCFYTCQTCLIKGNETIHNCQTCKSDYSISIENKLNCICDQFKYFDIQSNEYKCSSECDSSYKHKIFNIIYQGECINDCFKSNFSYIYNYQCFNKCPNGTIANFKNECIDNNECVINIYNTTIKIEDLNQEIFNKMVLAYKNEFLNNNMHIKYINSNDNMYSIVIFKNFDCLNSFHNYSFTKVYLGNCYDSLKKSEEISREIDLITLILIINRGTEQINQVQYYFYNPITGNPINDYDKCELYYNTTLIYPMKNIKNINFENVIKFNNYNINIFNESENIYNDICQNISDIYDFDIILSDRFNNYYYNISFCDDTCIEIGKDFNNFEVNCSCIFQASLSTNINYNQIKEKYYRNNSIFTFDVLKCRNYFFNNIFKFKGSIISFSILLIEIFCIFLYFIFGKEFIKQFIGALIISNPPKTNKNSDENNSINNEKLMKIPSFQKNNLHTSISKIKKNDLELNDKNEILNKIKNKENLKLGNIIQIKEGNNIRFLCNNRNGITEKTIPIEDRIIPEIINIKRENNENIENGISKEENKKLSISNNEKFIQKINDDVDSNLFYSFKDLENDETSNFAHKKFDKINELNVKSNQQGFSIIRKEKNSNFYSIIINNKKESKNYSFKIAKDILYDNNLRLNNFKFSTAFRLDKRSIFDFYCNQIIVRENFLYSFIYYNPLQSKWIRIIILLLKITFCILINLICFTKNYISDKFKLGEKNNIKFYFKHGWIRILISLSFILFIDFLLNLTRIPSNKIISLIKSNEKENKENIIIEEFKRINFQNNILIIVSLIIIVYTWFHATCFCFVYRYNEIDLIFSSFFIFCLEEIFQILLTFFYSIMRIYGIKYKSECSFNLSLFFIL